MRCRVCGEDLNHRGHRGHRGNSARSLFFLFISVSSVPSVVKIRALEFATAAGFQFLSPAALVDQRTRRCHLGQGPDCGRNKA